MVLTHHEKYDGTGYPNNLKGQDIPLYERIVAFLMLKKHGRLNFLSDQSDFDPQRVKAG